MEDSTLNDSDSGWTLVEDKRRKRRENKPTVWKLKILIWKLKIELIQANREMVERMKEARKLTNKIDKLKREKEKQPSGKVGQPEKDGAKDPISIFPEEVWEAIFHKLSDDKDIWNCSKVCTLFQIRLPSLSSTYLFGEIFPPLYKYFTGKEILGCRLVCQAWSAGVDHFFEEHKSLQPHNDELAGRPSSTPRFVNPMLEKKIGGVCMSHNHHDGRYPYSDSIFRKLSYGRSGCGHGQFDPRPRTRNPFIGRNVLVSRADRAGGKEMQRFLSTFGEHIWYLTMCDNKNYSESWEVTFDPEFQGHYLRFLPNLRKLRITGADCHLHEKILLDTLPSAPKLKSVQIEEVTNTTRYWREDWANFDALLVKYHNQLESVHVMTSNWERVCHLGWPNLTELHIMDWNWYRNKDYFVPLLKAEMPNLRKLGLTQHVLQWDLQTLFQVLGQLSSKSRLNTLRLSGVKGIGSGQTVMYAPPTLKTVELEHFHSSATETCYNVLLHFPFLENLHVFWKSPIILESGAPEYAVTTNEIDLRSPWQYDDYFEFRCCYVSHSCSHEDSGSFIPCGPCWQRLHRQKSLEIERRRVRVADEVVEVSKRIFNKDMYSSNIWKLLPQLKAFSFQRDVYTRERYEWVQKQMPKKRRK